MMSSKYWLSDMKVPESGRTKELLADYFGRTFDGLMS